MVRVQVEHVEARDSSRVHNGNNVIIHPVIKHATFNQLGRQKQAGLLGMEHEKKVLSWLSSVRFDDIHEEIRDEAELSERSSDESNDTKYTGKWLLESDVFRQWQECKIRELWYTGMPGAGKSTLASIIIERMTTTLKQFSPRGRHGKIAYVYFKHNKHYRTEEILGNIIQQVVRSDETEIVHRPIPRLVTDLYTKLNNRNPSGRGTSMFADAIHELSRDETIYIVIDAIDEGDDEVAMALISLLSPGPKPHSRVSLLVTSRIWRSFHSLSEGFHREVIRAHSTDLHLFVDHQFERRNSLWRVAREHPKMMSETRNLITWKSREIFLLARLHVQSLKLGSLTAPSSLAHGDLQKGLNELMPAELDLEDMYAKLSARILAQKDQGKDGPRAYRILAWVVLSPRQLSTSELREAMANDPVTKDLGNPDQKSTREVMRDICDGLVTFHEGQIRLVHYTADVYFSRNADRLFAAFRPQIARTCATYLSTAQLERSIEGVYGHPHCQMSAAAGFRNLGSNSVDREIEVHGEKLGYDVEQVKRQFYYAAELLEKFPLLPTPATTATHIAAWYGYIPVLRYFLETEENVNTADEFNRRPVVVALQQGHTDAVRICLEKGAQIDLMSTEGEEILIQICRRHDVESGLVRCVVEQNYARLDILQRDTSHGKNSWLQIPMLVTRDLAGRFGETVVKALQITHYASSITKIFRGPILDDVTAAIWHKDASTLSRIRTTGELSGIDKNSRLGRMPIFAAVDFGYLDTVILLIDSGVDVNIQDPEGNTPLIRAAFRGNVAMVKELLKRNANVAVKNKKGITAWSVRLEPGNEKEDAGGVDPDAIDDIGTPALYTHASCGNLRVLEWLLDKGINPSNCTRFAWAPLHMSAYNGHIACVEALLRKGAEHSPISNTSQTPLDMAMRQGHKKIIQVLREAGAVTGRELYASTSSSGWDQSSPHRSDHSWEETSSNKQLADPEYTIHHTSIAFAIRNSFQRGVEPVAGSQLSWWPLPDPEEEPRRGFTRVYSVRPFTRLWKTRMFYDDIPTPSAEKIFPNLKAVLRSSKGTGWATLGRTDIDLQSTTLMRVLQHFESAKGGNSQSQTLRSLGTKAIVHTDTKANESVSCTVDLGEDDIKTLSYLYQTFRGLPSGRWKRATGMKFYRSFHFKKSLGRRYVTIHKDKERYPEEAEPGYQSYHYLPRPWKDGKELPCQSGEAWYFFNNPDECCTSMQLNRSLPIRFEDTAESRFVAWGIHIEQRYSVLVILVPVLVVTGLTLIGTLWFISHWLGKHEDDLQNATVPATLALGVVQFVLQFLVSLVVFRWSI
ncbi:cyclin-dependent protein kinase complex component [Colletotrichum sojae]|uniref:Cyclin-dependent protein kinase complex component n=1 Tax=Colletotrichum sojae TaxID=2175907 RepID=A0A8H6JKB6_9PEZI|nr:cyclin-dependent protein kinase complex component [Colletotrichum sojae]